MEKIRVITIIAGIVSVIISEIYKRIRSENDPSVHVVFPVLLANISPSDLRRPMRLERTTD